MTRLVSGKARSFVNGDPLANVSITFMLVSEVATKVGEVYPLGERTVVTNAAGDMPAGFGLAVPPTGAWRYRCKIWPSIVFEFLLEAGGPITIDGLVALAEVQAVEAGTPQYEFWLAVFNGAGLADAGQVLTADGLGGADWAEVAEVARLTAVVTAVVNGSYEVDGLAGSVFNLTLTANSTIAFSNMTGRVVTLNLIQDAMGSRLVTWTAVAWGITGEPVLRTGAGERDKITFENNGLTTDGHYIEAYEA